MALSEPKKMKQATQDPGNKAANSGAAQGGGSAEKAKSKKPNYKEIEAMDDASLFHLAWEAAQDIFETKMDDHTAKWKCNYAVIEIHVSKRRQELLKGKRPGTTPETRYHLDTLHGVFFTLNVTLKIKAFLAENPERDDKNKKRFKAMFRNTQRAAQTLGHVRPRPEHEKVVKGLIRQCEEYQFDLNDA